MQILNTAVCRSVKICQMVRFSRMALAITGYCGLAFLWVFHFLLDFMACGQSINGLSSFCGTDSKHEKVAQHSEHGLSVGPFLRFEWIAMDSFHGAKRPIVKVFHALIGWITLDERSTQKQGRPNFHPTLVHPSVDHFCSQFVFSLHSIINRRLRRFWYQFLKATAEAQTTDGELVATPFFMLLRHSSIFTEVWGVDRCRSRQRWQRTKANIKKKRQQKPIFRADLKNRRRVKHSQKRSCAVLCPCARFQTTVGTFKGFWAGCKVA